MGSLEELRKKRNPSYPTNGYGPGIIGATSAYGGYQSNGHLPKSQPNGHGQMFLEPGNNIVSQGDDITSLNQNFAGINLNAGYTGSTKSNGHINNQSADYTTGGGIGNGIPQAFMHNGQLMFAGHYLPQSAAPSQAHLPPASPGVFGNFAAPFVGHNFAAYPHLFNSNSPMSSWQSSRVPSGDMPSLLTPRRDSSSSNENDPGTPFTQYTHYPDYSGGVTVIDRSPNSICTWSTPSPTQTGYNMAKYAPPSSISHGLQMLVQADPPIPPAVPAPSSPYKSLDRCLENKHGVTNVYVRGLKPTTTDDMLYALAARFGEIVSHKSIIDHSSGTCKGFGFVKFHNFKDAENCIRGFHYMGYETSFARESFYSQLKKLGDEDNTNLYVSNLPKEMNEHELASMFEPHKVCSSRILRDGQGNGRGVGFARFENRNVCDEIIKKFNNVPMTLGNGEEYIVQIRFADTPEQKELKRQTNQHRKLRTDEYEIMTGMRSSPGGPGQMNGDFESYMTKTTGIPKHPSNPYYGHNRFQTRSRLSKLSSQLSPHVKAPTVNINLPQVTNQEAAHGVTSDMPASNGVVHHDSSSGNQEHIENHSSGNPTNKGSE